LLDPINPNTSQLL